MGHYDDCYESDYAEQRRQARAKAEQVIPEVAALLEAARVKLAQNSQVINHFGRIEGDIEFIKSALYGQLARGV